MSDFIPDQTKNGKILVKPVRYLRKKPFVRDLVKKHGVGYLTDMSGQHEVRLDWKLNKIAQRDKVFKLQIDDKVVYLDLEELTFYTRIMFEK